jgi:single-strand DNA-binding protein
MSHTKEIEMSDVNFATVSGRLTRKPELRKTPSGVAVTDITIANNVFSKGNKEQTTYFRCTVWNKSAEFAAGLDKGDHVMIQSQMVDDNYTPKNAEKPTSGRLKLDKCKLTLLHRKNSTGEEVAQAPVEDPTEE